MISPLTNVIPYGPLSIHGADSTDNGFGGEPSPERLWSVSTVDESDIIALYARAFIYQELNEL
jgi:hypothetical protein